MSTTTRISSTTDVRTIENVSIVVMEWTSSPIHVGQTRIVLKLIFPDQYSEDVVFLIPGFTSQFVHTYGIQITNYTSSGFDVTIAPPATPIPLIKPGETTPYFKPPTFIIPAPGKVTPTSSVTCESCSNPQKSDMKFGTVSYNKMVKSGDSFKITVEVKSLASYIGDTARITVTDIDNSSCLNKTEDFNLSAGTSATRTFTGIMPDRDIKVHLSLWDINLIGKDCEDVYEFTLKKGDKTEDPTTDLGSLDWKKYAIYAVIALLVIYILYLMYRRK